MYQLLSGSAWAVTFLLIGVAWVEDWIYLGFFALALSAAGATWTVATYCSRIDRNIKVLFELGRDVGRDSVRRLP